MDRDSPVAGLLAGTCAFLIWGFAPLYFKFLDGIGAPEILAHRSIWSLVLALVVLVLLGKFRELPLTLRDAANRRTLLLSTVLIGGNWLVFIWAITNAHVLDASLGYYINPLVNVLLGVLFLGERLRPLQLVGVALAALGIAHELWQFGRIPVVAIFLALSFGFYGLVRKRSPVESLTGLAVETLFMFPAAVLYLLWIDSATSDLTANSLQLNTILVLAGPVTLLPLLLFNIAARRLTLSSVGLLQYLAPTLMLILATRVFGEPFTTYKLVTFACVWGGLAVYSVDALLWRRQQRYRRSLG